MTPDEALAQLRALHLPTTQINDAEFPLWVSPLLAVLATVVFCLWRRAARKKRWLNQAQLELKAIANDAATHHADRGWQRLAILLRRHAILHAPKENSASITGTAWLALLDKTLGVSLFSSGHGRDVIVRPYQDRPLKHDPELVKLCDDISQALTRLERKATPITQPNPAQLNKRQATLDH